MKATLYLLFFLLLTVAGYGQAFDSLHVYFPLDKSQLTEQTTAYLDSLVHSSILMKDKKIRILGYGDYLGSNSYNDGLSYSRAKNVQDYLVISGFNNQLVTLCEGKGKINHDAGNGKKGNARDRKVDIIIDKRIDTPAEEKFGHYILRLQENQTFALNNIHFFQGSIRITPESMRELKMLYRFLKDHSTIAIQLEGHVCCLGPFEGVDEPYDNSTLSQKRAEVIADSMFVYGIDRNRIKCLGMGNNNLVRDEETGAENELLSRRVEVKIISR